MYYAALRPEEVVSLGKDNIILPPLVLNPRGGKWGNLPTTGANSGFSSAAPEAGAEWTDDGRHRDHPHLKSRPVGLTWSGGWRLYACRSQIASQVAADLTDF